MTDIRRKATIAGVAMLVAVAACNFKREADAKFGDQHFKTAIALVELYKVRHGEYPAALTDLDFIGEWDRLALSSVEYHRLPEGYELNVTRGWVGRPTLEYPAQFWNGLLRRVPPNSFYGFRTPLTLSSPDVWYPANAFSGLTLLFAGLVSLALVWLLPAPTFARPWVPVVVFVVPLSLSLVASLLYLRRFR
jgi:hypothetical protein